MVGYFSYPAERRDLLRVHRDTRARGGLLSVGPLRSCVGRDPLEARSEIHCSGERQGTQGPTAARPRDQSRSRVRAAASPARRCSETNLSVAAMHSETDALGAACGRGGPAGPLITAWAPRTGAEAGRFIRELCVCVGVKDGAMAPCGTGMSVSRCANSTYTNVNRSNFSLAVTSLEPAESAIQFNSTRSPSKGGERAPGCYVM